MTFTCDCGTRDAETFPEIIDDVYICGWCRRAFDCHGYSVEMPVVHDPLKCAGWFCKEFAVADSEYCARHRDA